MWHLPLTCAISSTGPKQNFWISYKAAWRNTPLIQLGYPTWKYFVTKEHKENYASEIVSHNDVQPDEVHCKCAGIYISTTLTWVTEFFYFHLIRNVHIIHSNISITMMFAHNPLPLLSRLHNIFTCFSSPLIYRIPWVIDFKPIISFGTCIFGKYRCIGFKLQLVGKPRRENYKKGVTFRQQNIKLHWTHSLLRL